ncbi:hypothetical protein [Enterovibrio norvegicus]|uniref:hypothetical protein n=1 Tax=Enterovibrio norvegicus TaxID=188144 RepID=UPI00352BDA81
MSHVNVKQLAAITVPCVTITEFLKRKLFLDNIEISKANIKNQLGVECPYEDAFGFMSGCVDSNVYPADTRWILTGFSNSYHAKRYMTFDVGAEIDSGMIRYRGRETSIESWSKKINSLVQSPMMVEGHVWFCAYLPKPKDWTEWYDIQVLKRRVRRYTCGQIVTRKEYGRDVSVLEIQTDNMAEVWLVMEWLKNICAERGSVIEQKVRHKVALVESTNATV